MKKLVTYAVIMAIIALIVIAAVYSERTRNDHFRGDIPCMHQTEGHECNGSCSHCVEKTQHGGQMETPGHDQAHGSEACKAMHAAGKCVHEAGKCACSGNQ